jgi:hypothetical protein
MCSLLFETRAVVNGEVHHVVGVSLRADTLISERIRDELLVCQCHFECDETFVL